MAQRTSLGKLPWLQHLPHSLLASCTIITTDRSLPDLVSQHLDGKANPEPILASLDVAIP